MIFFSLAKIPAKKLSTAPPLVFVVAQKRRRPLAGPPTNSRRLLAEPADIAKTECRVR